MAYRRSRGKSGKIQPAVQTLTFATSSVSAGNTGTYYIDLSQCASLVNRRFYRQGIQWAVANFKLKSLQSGSVSIAKLPNTWVMSNAWEKGFRAWQKMNKDALEEAASVKPKFLDFKIYADADHHAVGYGDNLLPLDYAGGAYTSGEWEPSKYVIPRVDPTSTIGQVSNREIIAVGPSYPGNPGGAGRYDAVSLIEGYAASRGLPNVVDPNTPADSADVSGAQPENWLSALQNEGTDQDEEVLDDMISENNLAPYPFENDGTNIDTMYPGGANQAPTLEWHDTVEIYSASGIAGAGIGTQNGKGGMFPCGLIRIDWTPEAASNLVLQIDLVAGPHRGYLCAPMTEM